MAFPDDFVDPAFEEQPRRGVTRVFHGNQEGPASRDDPSRIDLLAAQVNDLLTRVGQLEARPQDLEGDLGDEEFDGDDEPPV